MLPRPATLLDLAIAANGHTVRECAEQTGLSASGLSNLVLGTRFPQNPDAFTGKVTPYLVAALLRRADHHSLPNEDTLKTFAEERLNRAYAREANLRALLENKLAAAGLARCAAQILAEFCQEQDQDAPFESKEAWLLLWDFVHPVARRLSLKERRQLFARYCALRVRHREHYYLDLFSQSPRRVEVADQSPIPKLDDSVCDSVCRLPLPPEPRPGESQQVLQVLKDAGLTSIAVPALKTAASLDVLMCLTDTIQVKFEHPLPSITSSITSGEASYVLEAPPQHDLVLTASCASEERWVVFVTYLP